MNRMIFISTLLLAIPAFGQTMYKCPDPSGVVKFQQMPCLPTGGGETMTVKPLAGSGTGLSDNAKAYLAERDRYRAEEAKAKAEQEKEERRLSVEYAKARATDNMAAAQRATAAAIWATGWRR